MTTDTITIRRPDDWHLHVRDGEMLQAVLPYTANHFGRAIMMPNLVPPVRTTDDAVGYRERIRAARPPGSNFEPLMMCYLTDNTDPDDVERGFEEGVFTGMKLYPANATTNSAAGVSDFNKITSVLERMQRIGMPFMIHGEEVVEGVDVFDREAVFIERRLEPMTKAFPELKFTLEHLSSKVAVDYVRAAKPQVAGSITPYHLQLNRTDWLGAGLRPYMYCCPVIKREEDRLALRQAATSGDDCFFLGTDSAPHPVEKKLDLVGIPGLFNSPVAIETYTQVFDEDNALDKLEAFASLNGPRHYGLPANEETITLTRAPWTAPIEVPVNETDHALVYRGGERIPWKVS